MFNRLFVNCLPTFYHYFEKKQHRFDLRKDMCTTKKNKSKIRIQNTRDKVVL